MAFLPLLALFAVQPAPQSDGSELMEKAIKATGLSYVAAANRNDFMVSFERTGNRREIIYIRAKHQPVGTARYHEIYTSVWSANNAPTDDALAQALAQQVKFGSFYLFVGSNGFHSIRFSQQFDATVLAPEPQASDPAVTRLKDLIYFANAVNLEMKKQ